MNKLVRDEDIRIRSCCASFLLEIVKLANKYGKSAFKLTSTASLHLLKEKFDNNHPIFFCNNEFFRSSCLKVSGTPRKTVSSKNDLLGLALKGVRRATSSVVFWEVLLSETLSFSEVLSFLARTIPNKGLTVLVGKSSCSCLISEF